MVEEQTEEHTEEELQEQIDAENEAISKLLPELEVEQQEKIKRELFEDIYTQDEIDQQINEESEYNEEDYAEWYEKQLLINAQDFADFNIMESKQFDAIVNKYKQLIGLMGDSYNIATKMIFYSVIANQIKLNSFSADANEIDLRIPLLVQLKAGHGKKNYTRFIRKTIQGLSKEYQEPTSYHPEQFVGKIIVHESKDENTYEPVFGTLASDFMVVDEAHALLTRKENEECLRYLRVALDPIGDNTIEKKQVNVPNEEKLKYSPTCTILLFTQPIAHVNEDLLVRGSFRRFIILFIDIKEQERIDAREKVQFFNLKKEVQIRMWDEWIKLNKRFSEYKDLKYICEDYKQIDVYLNNLAISSKKMGSEVAEFYNTSQFTIKQNILKMAIIRAVVEHNIKTQTITIKDKHIKDAIHDWDMIWLPQTQWIAGQLKMASLMPIGWEKNQDIYTMVIDELKLYNGSCESLHIVNKLKEAFKNVPQSYRLRKSYIILNNLSNWGYIKKEGAGKRAGYKITLVKEV